MAERFRRGELERVLWALKANKKITPAMPSEFGTRIRRLLEIDRAVDFVEAGAAFHAFSSDSPSGRGHDVIFSMLDLQMLWLGLELVEMGFKQREVVDQLRFARPILSKTLGPELNEQSDADPPLFLALPGVERSDFDWLRLPRPLVMSAEEIGRRAADRKLGKLVILPIGWQAFHAEEALALPAPRKRRRR